MATEKDPREVYLKGVRLSYPHLYEKQKANEDAEPKFSATALNDPTTRDGKRNTKLIEAALDEACMREFKKPFSKMKFKDDRCCYKDGNDCLTQSGDIKAGYEDMFAISASNKTGVTLLHRNKKPATDKDNSPFYGGCYVEMIVRFYGTKKGGAPGLFASLEAVRFWEDGEHFGSPPVDADAFDDDDEEAGFDDDDEFDV